MQRRGDRIDVLADLRSLQDPLYAGRGIGSHAEFLLATLRDRGSASLRLVGLVDPTGAPPAPGVAAACDELRPVFAADAAALGSGDAWQALIFSAAKEAGLQPVRAFASLYAAFLGRTNGPRAGWLLAAIDRTLILTRLRDAAAVQGVSA